MSNIINFLEKKRTKDILKSVQKYQLERKKELRELCNNWGLNRKESPEKLDIFDNNLPKKMI